MQPEPEGGASGVGRRGRIPRPASAEGGALEDGKGAGVDPEDVAPAGPDTGPVSDPDTGPARPGEPSDAELVRRVRNGDDAAYAELYRRHHAAVLRYARTCCRTPETAQDLTGEVFARTLHALRAGRGPTVAVRAYLLTGVRRVAAGWQGNERRLRLVDDFALFLATREGSATEPSTEAAAEVRAMEEADQSLVVRAFRSLPERWQAVLWHTAVEQEPPSRVAPLLGLTANATSVLAHRAREGLREAYLQAHVSRSLAEHERCRAYADRLGAATRGSLGARADRSLRRHLDDCPRCAAAYAELTDINSQLGALLPVAFIGWFAGGQAAAVLAAGAAGVAGASGVAAVSGVSVVGGSAGAGAGAGAGVGAGAAGAGAGSAGGVGGTTAVGGKAVGGPLRMWLAVGAASTVATALAWALIGGEAQQRPDAAPPPPTVEAPARPAPDPPAPRRDAPAPPEPAPVTPPTGVPVPPPEPPPPTPTPPPSPRPAPSTPSSPRPEPSAAPSAGATPPRPAPSPSSPPPTPAPAPPRRPVVVPVSSVAWAETAGGALAPARADRAVGWSFLLDAPRRRERGLPDPWLHGLTEPTPWEALWESPHGGGPLTIGGVRHDHGIGVLAPSTITVPLDGRCDRFRVTVGIDDETAGLGAATFRVSADGEVLADSGVLHGGEPGTTLAVEVTGRERLELEVRPVAAPALPLPVSVGLDADLFAHADWASARLTCAGG
ncbi:sigma-70 family RNA polymerase sigma factor [Allostreptomyces psammosilenae]|uniref:RNA polymerase sigma factor (Sigma-70 family) n=1 Tax=Allostreptomyces psammosilenae TaxID=1892865 RepID=A0A853A3P5_9ACTN|nr:sigma-70 family RNA polymerase sigma factor [Allostreptomyces psammosilenae]NYI05132.1 RNA polymerase sigma factor (sigma-70 family) [Allostreptomyces psammosilenae]